MNKRKFFLLPICLLLLGACNTTPSKQDESKPASEAASSQVVESSKKDGSSIPASKSSQPGKSSQGEKSSSQEKSSVAPTKDQTGHIWGADTDVAAEGEGVAYKKALCTENDNFIKLTINQSQVTYASGSSRKNGTPDGYTKLDGNGQSMSFKFNYDQNAIGKLYLYGCMDGWGSNSAKKAFSYNGSPNIEVKVNGEALDIASLSDVVYTDFLSGDGSDLSDDGYGCIGDISLIQGVNEISYKRLASMNTLIKDFVLVIQNHTHNFPTTWTHTKTPTCTEAGLDERTCPGCGRVEKYVVEALGHDWDNGVVTTPATDIAEGVKTFTCKREGCGATRTEAIAKINGYDVTFVPDAHCKVLVFSTKQYDTEIPVETNTTKAKDENGNVVEYDPEDKLLQPQISFKVVCDNGYVVKKDNVTVTGTYKNIKQDPDSTGALDIFRITKIQTNLTITIASQEDTGEEQKPGYVAEFVASHCQIKVYVGPKDETGSNIDEGPEYLTRSKDSPFGYTLNNGQLNFEVIPDAGYKFDSGIEVGGELVAAPFVAGNFNKVNREAENVYRITKINSNIAINIKCIPEGGEAGLGYEITFVGEHCQILVFENGQDYRFAPSALVDGKTISRTEGGDAAKYVPDDAETPDVDEEIKPQVNFKVVCEEGYEFVSGVAAGAEAKASAISFITGDFNKFQNKGDDIYRVTKIKGDLVITITATAIAA